MRISVTKLDAARRQLETAIQLYATNGDPVSIHTLCCAAYNVVHALNKKRNKPAGLDSTMMLKDLEQFLTSKRDKQLFHDAMNESANFFKHASTDSEASHSFDTNYTEVLLWDSIQKYGMLVGEISQEMMKYFGWFVFQHPEILNIDQLSPDVRQAIEKGREVLVKDGREAFFRDVGSGGSPIKI
jgi:hypothetical protein